MICLNKSKCALAFLYCNTQYSQLIFWSHFFTHFFLNYRVVIYLLLFGFQINPLLELNSDPPPMHCCSHEPQAIRAEVEVLRQDFNMRVKKILFNSIVGAYYTSFIPCCFAQVSEDNWTTCILMSCKSGKYWFQCGCSILGLSYYFFRILF